MDLVLFQAEAELEEFCPGNPCGDTFSRALGQCPNCGWRIPKQEIERVEAEEREKKMHEEKAAQIAILAAEPHEERVDAVTLHRHKKEGSPDSVKVQYRCGIQTYREWICLDHEGYAGKKARTWWARRFGEQSARMTCVDDALSDLFLAISLTNMTEAITVRLEGKHNKIIGYRLRRVGS